MLGKKNDQSRDFLCVKYNLHFACVNDSSTYSRSLVRFSQFS